MARDFLTVADVLGMHTVLMQRYGGVLGVRDLGRGHDGKLGHPSPHYGWK